MAVVAGVAIHRITDDEALREAQQLTRTAALSAVEPDLTDGLVAGDPDARARLDRAVRARVLRFPVVRVKLWTLDGRIVYSDARRLIGRRFPLSDGERRAARRGVVNADVSDAARPENTFERGLGHLLEVRRVDPPIAGDLEGSAAVAREAQRDLRAVLVTLHLPNLHRVGLRAALPDVAAPLREAGVDVELDIAHDDDLAPNAEALVYRVAEEALRNAHQHADAGRVDVTLRREDGRARLRVSDDGRGFPPGEPAERYAGGHRGLALLRDLAVDAGGELTVRAAPGRGTILELDAPIR